jgi:hypothetical protein
MGMYLSAQKAIYTIAGIWHRREILMIFIFGSASEDSG